MSDEPLPPIIEAMARQFFEDVVAVLRQEMAHIGLGDIELRIEELSPCDYRIAIDKRQLPVGRDEQEVIDLFIDVASRMESKRLMIH